MIGKMARWMLLGAALALLAAPAARADYETGRKAWSAGRHVEAVAEWHGAAAGGDARAMLALGRAYLKGLGVPQDYVLAHMWFNLSASRGEDQALKERDALSARMTPGQIASAQDRARAWRPGGQAAAPRAAPASPTPAGPPPKRALAEAQRLLNALGYEAGSPDGIWGRRSVQAYRAFLRDSSLPPAESLTPDSLRVMRKAAKKQPSPPKRPPSLHKFAKSGDIDGLKAAIAVGADVNARDARGQTPLIYAVDRGHALSVPILLNAGADPNIQSPDGVTALFISVLHDHSNITGLLMESGGNPLIKGPKGKTVVDIAKAKYGNAYRAMETGASEEVLSILKKAITPSDTINFLKTQFSTCGYKLGRGKRKRLDLKVVNGSIVRITADTISRDGRRIGYTGSTFDIGKLTRVSLRHTPDDAFTGIVFYSNDRDFKRINTLDTTFKKQTQQYYNKHGPFKSSVELFACTIETGFKVARALTFCKDKDVSKVSANAMDMILWRARKGILHEDCFYKSGKKLHFVSLK